MVSETCIVLLVRQTDVLYRRTALVLLSQIRTPAVLVPSQTVVHM